MLVTSRLLHADGLSWTISLPCFVLIAQAVFLLQREQRHTRSRRQTDKFLQTQLMTLHSRHDYFICVGNKGKEQKTKDDAHRRIGNNIVSIWCTEDSYCYNSSSLYNGVSQTLFPALLARRSCLVLHSAVI